MPNRIKLAVGYFVNKIGIYNGVYFLLIINHLLISTELIWVDRYKNLYVIEYSRCLYLSSVTNQSQSVQLCKSQL